MSDEALRIMQTRTEIAAEPVGGSLADLFPQSGFDEAAYLHAYPDVAAAMVRGDVRSGYQHFIHYGLREGRLPPGLNQEPKNRLVRFISPTSGANASSHLAHHFESLHLSRSGG